MKESIMYCQKYKTGKHNKSLGDYLYTHFMNNSEVTRLFDKTHEVYEVEVKEVQVEDNSSYWGWWDNKINRFNHVHPTRGILSMVFPYAMEEYVKRGDGKDYNVVIKEICVVKEEVK